MAPITGGNLRVLGLDPGFGRLGFGVLDVRGQGANLVEFGCWETSAKLPFAERLAELAANIRLLIRRTKPQVVAVEELFFCKNLKTAINVAQARGAIILLAQESGLPIVEMTPLQVKQSLCGYGRAEKGQMQKMIQMILKLKEKPRPDDAADALAIALVGAGRFRLSCLDR